MSFKKLGVPTTIGELRELIKPYGSETPFGFRNQPIQDLVETGDGKETFVSFQEQETKEDVFKQVNEGVMGNERWVGNQGIKKVPFGFVMMFYCSETDVITSSVFIPLETTIVESIESKKIKIDG